MYTNEVKEKIFSLFPAYTVQQLADMTEISIGTLYQWRKEYDNLEFVKDVSKEIKELVSNDKLEEARRLAEEYPNDDVIQSQLLEIYRKFEWLSDAERIARKFPSSPSVQGEMIKFYSRRGDSDTAIQLANQFPDNALIQSLLMKVYISKNESEKAMAIADKFPDNAIIQGQVVNEYLNQSEYEKAIEIANRFPNDAPVQRRVLGFYKAQNNYKKVLEIASRFKDDERIQYQLRGYIIQESKRINEFLKNGDIISAKNIAIRYPEEKIIQGQLMKIYVRLRDLENGQKLANQYLDEPSFQSMLISLYLKKHMNKEAEMLAKKFSDHPTIASQLVTIYIRSNRYQEALEIGEQYKDSSVIQGQLLGIYFNDNNISKIAEIKYQFPKNEIIDQKIQGWKKQNSDDAIQLELLLNSYSGKKENDFIHNQETFIREILLEKNTQKVRENLYTIRAKLSLNTITIGDIHLIDEIKDSITDTLYKTVLASIYERIGLEKKSIAILKELKTDENKNISKIIRELESKKNKLYNLEKWDQLLGWFTDEGTVYVTREQDSLSKKEDLNVKNSVVRIEKEKVQVEKPKKKEEVNTIILSPKVVIPTTKKKNIDKKKEKVEQSIKALYDTLTEEWKEIVLEIKLNYYVKMNDIRTQKEYINKYDQLERILASQTNLKNEKEKLILIMIREGYLKLIEREFPDELEVINQKVKSRINKN